MTDSEVPRNRFDLETLFKDCSKVVLEETYKGGQIRNKLEALSTGVSLQGVFSENEEFDDIDTSDLGFALVDYWLGVATLRDEKPGPPDPPKRLAKLQQARALLDRYLYRCTKLRLYKDSHEDEDDGEKKPKPDAAREEKIARFKRKRVAEENLKTALDERDKWKCRLEIAIVESLDELDGIKREEEILQYMVKEKPVRPEGPKAPVSRPIEVTKIGPTMEIKKETFQNGVFKPYHRLPTMSLEEYAEIEMKQLEERTKREAEQKQQVKLSLNELQEQGLEDVDELHDTAQEKARKWDDWKDSVPKGSGVTKRF